MSLVEEALRKQEQEAGKHNHPFFPSSPAVVPPSVAPPAAATSPFSPTAKWTPVVARPGLHPDIGRQRNLARMIVVGVGLLALVLLAVVLLSILANTKKQTGSVVMAPVRAPAIPPPSVAAIPPPAVVTPAPIAVLVTPAASHPARTSAVPVVAAAAAPVAGIVPLVSNATVAAAVVVAPAHSEPADGLAPVAPPLPPDVIWPEIKVKGTFSGGGKTLVLLGDGLTLEPGSTAPNGVRLLEATPVLARVSFQGQIRTYRRNGRDFTACTNEASTGFSGL